MKDIDAIERLDFHFSYTSNVVIEAKLQHVYYIQYKHELFIRILIYRMQNNIVKKSMENIWLDWKILLWQKGCQQLWQTGRISV